VWNLKKSIRLSLKLQEGALNLRAHREPIFCRNRWNKTMNDFWWFRKNRAANLVFRDWWGWHTFDKLLDHLVNILYNFYYLHLLSSAILPDSSQHTKDITNLSINLDMNKNVAFLLNDDWTELSVE